MTDFKISTDIELPVARRGSKPKYPWDEIPVGGSFFVPGKNSANFGGAVRSRELRRRAEKWATRTVTEDGVKGVRVWRVK